MLNQIMWIIPFQPKDCVLPENNIQIRDLEYPNSKKRVYKDLSCNFDFLRFTRIIKDRVNTVVVIEGEDVSYAVYFDEDENNETIAEMSLECRSIQNIFRVLISKSFGGLSETGYLSGSEVIKVNGSNVDRVLKFLDKINNGTLLNCKGNRGQVLVAKELGGMNLGNLYTLASGLGKVEELGWTQMYVPYAMVEKFESLLEADTVGKYRGNKGQILMAKELGGMHLGQLYSLASGLGKIEELGWTQMHVPYATIAKFESFLEEDTEAKYKGNRGQILMAKELGGMNLGNLYTLASGLGKVEELGWTQMNVPYAIVDKFEGLLKEDTVGKYRGNRGQILMAKELGGMNLGNLYTLASGLGKVEELGWTYMNVPYAMVEKFEPIILGLIQKTIIDEYTGYRGKLRFVIEFGFNINALIALSEVYNFDDILYWRQKSKKGLSTVKGGLSLDTYGIEGKGLNQITADAGAVTPEDQIAESQIQEILKNILNGIDLDRNILKILEILNFDVSSERGKVVAGKLRNSPHAVLELFQD
jgi:hypothetical protein